MKRALILGLLVVACRDNRRPVPTEPTPPPAAEADAPAPVGLRLTDATRIRLADADRGRELLGARDEFIAALTPFDRQARTGRRDAVDEAAFLAHVRANVVDWDDTRRRAIESSVARLAGAIDAAGLALPLPPVIDIVLTTGDEEAPGSGYTRGRTIVLTRDSIAQSPHQLLAHELFHVLSRNAPELRDRLYRAIGFEPIAPVELPAALTARRITNPDAPVVAHAIRIQHDGRERLATPVLVAPRDYDGGSLFDYLAPRLYVLDDKGAPALDGGAPVTISFDEAGGFFDQVGRNTGYVIHPEEILADNFRQIVFAPDTVASPEVHERIRGLLRQR